MAAVSFNKITPARFGQMLQWIAHQAPDQEALLRLNERVIKPIVRDPALVSPESSGQVMVAPELVSQRLLQLPAREKYRLADKQSRPVAEIADYLYRRIYGCSVIGWRNENQDKISVFTHRGAVYLLLLDGMGGLKGGEFAARIAVQEIERWVKKGASPEEAINLAHERVRVMQQLCKETPSMGTTVVTAVVKDGRATVYSVGDSLAFWAQRNSTDIILLNSLGLPLKSLGLNGPPFRGEEAVDAVLAVGRMNRGLKYALGHNMPEKIESLTVELRPGDQLLLASDGLALYYAELLAHLSLADPPKVIVRQLIYQSVHDQRNKGRRPDNTSAVLLEY
jgi:serine/threonine protein phosphatase PrpC